jgi:hypothetical protein
VTATGAAHTVRLVRTGERWVELYVDGALFDANSSLAECDILGLLRKVGCVVLKEEVERRGKKSPAAKNASKKVSPRPAKPRAPTRRRS